MPIQYNYELQDYCIDETMIIVTKKVNKHICQGYSVPLLLLILYQMSLSADNFLFQIITKGCKNDRMGQSFIKERTETSKEKSI